MEGMTNLPLLVLTLSILLLIRQHGRAVEALASALNCSSRRLRKLKRGPGPRHTPQPSPREVHPALPAPRRSTKRR